MKKLFIFFLIFTTSISYSQTGNVGIGTIEPKARLHVADSSVVFTAESSVPINIGNVPVSGAGRRMMWYADKAAFRVGYTDNTSWDKDSIGIYSFAAGAFTKAKGTYSSAMGFRSSAVGNSSTAMGSGTAIGNSSIALGGFTLAGGNTSTALGSLTIASGDVSTAIGGATTASAFASTAMGSATTASGAISTAMGYSTIASGIRSTAMGESTWANGDFSTAMGSNTFAEANHSTAIGNNTSAYGDYSTAMGNKIIASGTGSFSIGDNNQVTTGEFYQGGDNHMLMRFVGGYYFYSNADYSAGVKINPGGGSWTNASDRRIKENFNATNNEEILKKISAIPITNWNYKSQPKTQKHIGPMAQDFYKAFHLDGDGADTTINTMDIIGVNMAAIQALEKRTQKISDIDRLNIYLQEQITVLQKQNEEIKTQLRKITEGLKKRKM